MSYVFKISNLSFSNSRLLWIRWSLFFLGFAFGLLVSNKYLYSLRLSNHCNVFKSENHRRRTSTGSEFHSQDWLYLTPSQQSSNIYVGMMSAGKFINNRVQRALDSWLRKGNWKVEVFADGDISRLLVPSGLDFNIVTLPSVDDQAYPPQKKCFMMIRHMSDKYIDSYDWFLRVDDDVYMDYPRLTRLLSTINSSLPVFFGTPGFGIDPDDGMEVGMYYLMGGPGMIFSRGLLRLLRSRLSYCVQHMFSPHEDIEIGRCVWKQVKGAIIPKAWETLDFFYQQYDKDTGDVVNIVLDDLTERRTKKTVSYHAVKKESLLYQLHKLVLTRKQQRLLNRTTQKGWEIRRMNALLKLHNATSLSPKHSLSDLPIVLGWNNESLEKRVAVVTSTTDWLEYAPWTPPSPIIPRYSSQLVWLNWDKYYRHQNDDVVPMRGHSSVEQTILWKWMTEAEERFLKKSCPALGKDPQFSNGYLKITPYDGVYLSITYKSFSSRGLDYCSLLIQVGYGVLLSNDDSATLLSQVYKESKCASPIVKARNGGLALPLPSFCRSSIKPPNVVLIIPLQGRYKAMQHFMELYEKNFLLPRSRSLSSSPDTAKVQLIIVLLGETKDELGLNDAAANLLKNYQRTYGSSLIRYHMAASGDRDFSRGAGIQLGSLAAGVEDILFFMDIDMIVTRRQIEQCRILASKGARAWYPISFSQYDPERLCYDGGFARSVDDNPIMDLIDPGEAPGHAPLREQIADTPLVISEERGFWRDFGYGIACMYKSDFIRAGGFDLSIEGWGEEDIRMYLSLLKSGLDVFRSKQVDLIHIHHTKTCKKSLPNEQLRACKSTKASHYAGKRCLAKTFFERTKSKEG